MKRYILAALLFPCLAHAQVTGLVGQTAGGAINQQTFNANTDTAGFNEMALTPSLAVPTTATTQAAGTVITTRTTLIATCSGTTGVVLPAVQSYRPITIINRSGGSCLVWPSVGATVETAPGTAGAINAPFTMLTNTNVTFRPITATAWYQ